MKFQVPFLIALLTVAAAATPIEKRTPKYIAHQVEPYDLPVYDKREELLDFADTGTRYTVDLKIGSSKEKVKVIIDSASWRLNIPGSGGKCINTHTCPVDGIFHPEESNTFHNLSIFTKSYYGRGQTIVSAFKVTDDFFFDNGDKIPQFQFDLANATTFERGFFGIRRYSDQNASYVYAAKNAGLVDHAGFSLYLGNQQDKSGKLLVGAIDTAKYEGELALFNKTDYTIQPKSITTGDGEVIQFTRPVNLDSGNPRLSLDRHIVDAIYKEVGANEQGVAPCDNVLNGNKSLKFDLGEITVNVPYSRLYSRQLNNPNCCTGVIVDTYSTGSEQNLGIQFIEQIYLASSFESDTFGIAPVKHTDESNIVDFWF